MFCEYFCQSRTYQNNVWASNWFHLNVALQSLLKFSLNGCGVAIVGWRSYRKHHPELSKGITYFDQNSWNGWSLWLYSWISFKGFFKYEVAVFHQLNQSQLTIAHTSTHMALWNKIIILWIKTLAPTTAAPTSAALFTSRACYSTTTTSTYYYDYENCIVNAA